MALTGLHLLLPLAPAYGQDANLLTLIWDATDQWLASGISAGCLNVKTICREAQLLLLAIN